MPSNNFRAISGKIATDNAKNPPQSVHLVKPVSKRGTCALQGCRRRQYVNGVCKCHGDQIALLLDRFFVIGLELVELLARPGVHEVEQIEGAHPFVSRACSFLNRATAHWATDMAAFETHASRNEDETPAQPTSCRGTVRRKLKDLEELALSCYSLELRLQDLANPKVQAFLPSLRSSAAQSVAGAVFVA